MKRSILFFLIVCLAVGCHGRLQPKTDILHDICRANRLFDIYQSEKLAFTFNAELPGKIVKRNWTWNIRQNRIFLNGEEQGLSQAFINDIHWLLFPLKAYEASDQIQLKINKNIPSPLQSIESTEVVVRYTSGKGYTPNDTYRLYVDENFTILEWAYFKEGKAPPRRITSWEQYINFSGIRLSLLRKGPDGFKVWFSDIEIE